MRAKLCPWDNRPIRTDRGKWNENRYSCAGCKMPYHRIQIEDEDGTWAAFHELAVRMIATQKADHPDMPRRQRRDGLGVILAAALETVRAAAKTKT